MNADDMTVERLPGGLTLGFAETYATDAHDLWSAVTEPDRLARWMTVYRGDLRLGGSWEALADDGSVWGRGTVTACDAPRSFTTTWQAEGEDSTTLTVVLEAVPSGTRLVLRHEGIRSPYYGAGWATYLAGLTRHVADPVAPSPPAAAWDEHYGRIRESYEARLT